MPMLEWNKAGERFFESGLDRGVLYVGGVGVAWSGLTSVSETSLGGSPKPYYIDGIKYLNLSTSEEYEATLTAFASPAEFGVCDGVVSVQKGLYVTQQKRSTFGLSYRTRIGNAVVGTDFAYKIHLVYNALAAPSDRSNTTLSDSVNSTELSWRITTLPPPITGYRRTAHFVIDSTKTPAATLQSIEDILYGSASQAARLPTVAELLALFNA